MDRITSLCKQYTDLTDQEIDMIRGMTGMLQPLANLDDADIFVDCPTRDGDAIVVAEAKPEGAPSSYKMSVVGLLAKPENEPAVARTFMLGVATKQVKAITQERTRVIQSVEPIKNGDRVIGVLIQEKRDESGAVRDRLHFSEQSFQHMADMLQHVPDGNSWLPECIDEALLLVDEQGIVMFRNSLARELYERLGYVGDILGQRYENVRLIDEPDGHEEPDGYTATEILVSSRTLLVKRIQIRSEKVQFGIIIRDITDQREQEKQLILKSVAIKEIHHRVKNNLQTIASLLRLQTRRTDNQSTREVLSESMNRILSIAATHELLAQSGVDQVRLGEVLINIKNNAVRYFAPQYLDLHIAVEGDDFPVDSEVATSVALVTNELLQNSLKYAFVGRESGNIRIMVTRGDLYSAIAVIDDGCGFDADAPHKDRLGLSIVQTLIKDKLHGRLSIHSGPGGTTVTFDFQPQLIELTGVT